jgi:NADH-quinone oxidoreductase subunit A
MISMAPANFVFFMLVFTIVAVIFLFIHLVMGSFIRPSIPDAEKLTIYECGEPTVGSAWVQFDLRYYVVALLFVIFDVEVAFFFPWAAVFGKANQLSNPDAQNRTQLSKQLEPSGVTPARKTALKITKRDESVEPIQPGAAASWAFIAFWDIAVFFGVLLVGFAYVWRRGDIDWVRAYGHHQEPAIEPEKPLEQHAAPPVAAPKPAPPPVAVH